MACLDFANIIKAGENCPECGEPWEDHRGWLVDWALNRNFVQVHRGEPARYGP